MSPLVIVLLCASVLVKCAELPTGESNGSAREEKFRSALIDAFQNIKKGSAKGGFDDEGPLNSDLIGSKPPTRPDKAAENFELFADDDGLSFADISESSSEQKHSSTEKSHYVQHIVKTTKPLEKTTTKPRGVLGQLNDSIRDTVNESRLALKKEHVNTTNLLGIENMLRIFDADILVNQWRELQKRVSGQCRQDLQDYVDGLEERQLWALKSKLHYI